MTIARPLAERFWEKVDIRGPTECWPWLASCTKHGYGQIGVGNEWPEYAGNAHAHRVALKLSGRTPPVGADVHHECGNKICMNPAHLTIMESQDHGLLHADGGQWLTGTCSRGHDLTGDNVGIDKRGRRRCLQCSRDRQNGYNAKKRGVPSADCDTSEPAFRGIPPDT